MLGVIPRVRSRSVLAVHRDPNWGATGPVRWTMGGNAKGRRHAANLMLDIHRRRADYKAPSLQKPLPQKALPNRLELPPLADRRRYYEATDSSTSRGDAWPTAFRLRPWG